METNGIWKRGTVKIGSDGEDRISNLEDSLLIHILPFLHTKYVVRTSILSTRWRSLWASVPNLIFHVDPSDIPMGHTCSFMNFVDRVLLLHDLSHIHKFSFHYDGTPQIDLNRVNAWICAVVKRRVQELHINIHRLGVQQPFNFPLSLFTCETLVNLTLGSCSFPVINVPNSVYFPNLKTLNICVANPNDSLTQKLFCSCPVLEDLYLLAHLEEEKEVTLNICIPALRKFRLDMFGYPFGCSDPKVVVDAPGLVDLFLDESILACYSIKSISSLAKVSIDVKANDQKYLGRDHANRVLELLRGISNVKSLYLSTRTLIALDCAEGIDPLTFRNLTHLTLGFTYWSMLLDLRAKMPNLESMQLASVIMTVLMRKGSLLGLCLAIYYQA